MNSWLTNNLTVKWTLKYYEFFKIGEYSTQLAWVINPTVLQYLPPIPPGGRP
jgi:hypothetical protein